MPYGAAKWTPTKQAQNKRAAAQTKMERSMLNITYKDRKTNIWVRERTKVIDIINDMRTFKWPWARHISRPTYDRWTSHVTTWDHTTRKDDKGDQQSDEETTWINTGATRYMLTWRRHAEAGHYGSPMLMMKMQLG